MAQKFQSLFAVREERRKLRVLRENLVAVDDLAADRHAYRLFKMPLLEQLAHRRALRFVVLAFRRCEMCH